MIRAIAAFALVAAASSQALASADASTLVSTAPWWEKVTVTVSGDGNAKTCRFESSLKPGADAACEVEASATGAKDASGTHDQYTRITFERRFSPGAVPDAGQLHVGDTLLGRQVMALAIGSDGQVNGCEIVARSGDMAPEYGCKEAAAERFEASASTGAASSLRTAYMTIIVYGHAEHIV